ncbi:hypothetical protein DDK07_00285 [Mycobacteroides abscessus]|nr:hypothetical protein DDT46_02675 [Mycobacteroides abscessus]SID25642.1 Uncharacterised protein [Mycobacteroides abscessus subsp. abscessus]MBE5435479.1 hypothetical protein [Mycobacteroides abscessus]PVA44153.1 hypothetical protein DDJ35_21795 [Mycobacteroides abscessus]PVA73729.1 hypothetical protein DDJ37_15090 [Mycobacteroides abscessus]
MSKYQKITVGFLTCGTLSLLTLIAIERIVSAIRRECLADSSVGDGLGFLIAAPPILFGTIVATGVAFALTVSLVKRDWSVYAAIGVAVLIAAVMVVVGVGYVYDAAGAAGELCSNGIPHWWPFPA